MAIRVIYIRNDRTIAYRIHSGMVGGRWVRDQEAHIVRFSQDVCKIPWDEPTGTCVSISINFKDRHTHGVIFFPRWIAEAPEKTVCYQNDFLDQMREYRDAGPTYPILVVDEFAKVTFVEDCGRDNAKVIDTAPANLPEGYSARRN